MNFDTLGHVLVVDPLASFRAEKLQLRVEVKLMSEDHAKTVPRRLIADNNLSPTPEIAFSFWDMIRMRRFFKRLLDAPPQYRKASRKRVNEGSSS